MGLNASSEEECSYQSRLLQDFMNIPSIDKAWTFTSNGGSQVMFSLTQPNLQADKKRKYVLSSQISRSHSDTIEFQWAAFPIEMGGASIIVPSPSGSKLLVVHNSQIGSPTRFEIWGQCGVEKEFHIPASLHGSVFSDGWFEGISWNYDETLIAYVAEEPLPAKPTFTRSGFKKGNSSTQDDCGSWKGQGDWDEGWGEAYAGKRQPALFVINIDSGEVRAVEKTDKSLSVGQVVWAPLTADSQQYLVFVGWPSARKFGIKYCTNRHCALYAIEAPFVKLEAQHSGTNANTSSMVKLTDTISSAMFPRFSPDGKFLVFLSSKSAVDSGAHCATDSLHRIAWPNGKPCPPAGIIDVVPVVMHAHKDSFPGLYCSNPGLYHSNILSQPWLSDGHTILLTSVWGSSQAILSIDIISGEVSRISPSNSSFSWEILALDGDNIIAVCSSPVDIPEIKYGVLFRQNTNETAWNWLDTASPIFRSSAKVNILSSSHQFSILEIPVSGTSENSYEAVFVSSKLKKHSGCDPLVVVLHGGPHAVSLTSFCNTSAFLCSLGFNLLMVNYRGSLGFGEEALQSLPGKVGSQDVKDVLHAIDYVIDMGFADSSKIAVTGISHGGFLTTHLIGQAPEKFAAAAALNPVCNFALMVGTTDIPDWCYFEALGSEGKLSFTEAPSAQHLEQFYNKSPISHVSKVKAPTLVLLGGKDLRVPIPDGLQYARALKEKGVEVKVMMFPDDIHPIDKPQSEYESFLNIGVWFKKYCC